MHKTKKSVKWIGSLILSAALLCGCSSAASSEASSSSDSGSQTFGASTVSTDGSTSMEKVIGSLAEQFQQDNQDITVTYNPTGSGSGIQAVSEGRCDIGLSSRNLKEDEKNNGLEETTLALDGIAVIVNPSNTVDNLDMESLSRIYTGEITNWKDLGGADEEIVVIGREAGSGTRDGFESITDTSEKCAYRQELTSTGDVITAVSQNSSAIGYASLEGVKDTVKTLSIDNVSPSTATIQDGTYVIQRPFIMVTKSDQPLSDSAQKFYDYALSNDAAAVIESAGAVTVR